MAKKQFKPGQGYTRQEWDDTEFPEMTDDELAASIGKDSEAEQDLTRNWLPLRLSGEVIDKYKAGGAGWQSRIDADLRKLNKIK